MTDWLVLDPVVSPVILSAVLVVLLITFVRLEIKRPSKYLVWRLISVVFMIVSLAAIFIRPSIKRIKSESILLLTKGYDKAKVDSLIAKENFQLVSLPDAEPYRESKTLSINDLSNLNGNLAYVVGTGLSPSAKDILKDESYQFIPAVYPEGIIYISLPERIFSNRENRIEGVIQNNKSESVKIILESPGKKEDSVTINKNGLQKFELTFSPRESGNFLFNITVKYKDEIQSRELLPVTVRQQQSSRIIFIQNFPTFESQYLKNFLGKNHELNLRYQLSKNTYRHEAVNAEIKKITKLNATNLGEFDLLVIDSDALEGLSSAEISDLHKSVKNGLGLLILYNQSPEKARIAKSFLPVTFKKYPADTARINLKKQITLSAWASKPESSEDLHSVTKNKSRILSGYTNDGFGKIGFQLLQETYHLILDGDSISYSKIWTDLIESASRKTKGAYSISFQNKFPVYQDEPVNVQIISSVNASGAPIVTHDSVKLSIEENLFIDNIWKTKFWADKPGWHSVTVTQDSTTEYYYVPEKNSWKSLAAANSIRETLAGSSSGKSNAKQTEIPEPINPLVFYLIFLISAGLLWLLPKL